MSGNFTPKCETQLVEDSRGGDAPDSKGRRNPDPRWETGLRRHGRAAKPHGGGPTGAARGSRTLASARGRPQEQGVPCSPGPRAWSRRGLRGGRPARRSAVGGREVSPERGRPASAGPSEPREVPGPPATRDGVWRGPRRSPSSPDTGPAPRSPRPRARAPPPDPHPAAPGPGGPSPRHHARPTYQLRPPRAQQPRAFCLRPEEAGCATQDPQGQRSPGRHLRDGSRAELLGQGSGRAGGTRGPGGQRALEEVTLKSTLEVFRPGALADRLS